MDLVDDFLKKERQVWDVEYVSTSDEEDNDSDVSETEID